jgi:PST family polysaccharide transporter
VQLPHLRKLGTNVSWLLFDRVLRMGVGVIVLGIVSRFLTPPVFGELNYAISLVALFAAVATLGVDGIVIRELVRRPDHREEILGSAWMLKSCGALLAMSLVLAVCLITERQSGILPLAIIISVGFLPQSFDVVDLWFQRHLQSKITVLAKLGALLGSAGVKLTLVRIEAPLHWFAVAQAGDTLFVGLALVFAYHRNRGSVRAWRPSARTARTLLRDGWPLIFAGVLVALYARVEQFLVRALLDTASMGIYYAAVRITDMWNFVPSLILSSIYPILVEKRQESREDYERWLQMVFDLLTGLGFVVAIGATLCGSIVISLVFGEQYRAASTVLLIQAWIAPITFGGTVRAQYFLIEGLTTYHWWAAIIGIAANLAMGLWLMPMIGAPGAAVAALAGYFLSAYVTSWWFPDLRACARMQTKAFLVPFRLPELARSVKKWIS